MHLSKYFLLFLPGMELVHLVTGRTWNTACFWYTISTTSSVLIVTRSSTSDRLFVISFSLTKKRYGVPSSYRKKNICVHDYQIFGFYSIIIIYILHCLFQLKCQPLDQLVIVMSLVLVLVGFSSQHPLELKPNQELEYL